MAMAEGLANTCPDARGMGPDFGAPMFACHQAKIAKPFACAGWLAVAGSAHPGVRLAVFAGQLPVTALQPSADSPVLHRSFEDLIAKLRAQAHTETEG